MRHADDFGIPPEPPKRKARAKGKAKAKAKATPKKRAKKLPKDGEGYETTKRPYKRKETPETETTKRPYKRKETPETETTKRPYKKKDPASKKATFARRPAPKKDPPLSFWKALKGAYEAIVEERVSSPSVLEDGIIGVNCFWGVKGVRLKLFCW